MNCAISDQSSYSRGMSSAKSVLIGICKFSFRYFRDCFLERNGLAESEEEGDEENLYFSKEILTTILNQWMGIYPLWSGILLGDLRRYDKTGNLKADEPVETISTNSLVDNYFGIHFLCISLSINEFQQSSMKPLFDQLRTI